MTDIIDISQTLGQGLPVWPGDTAFESKPVWQIDGDCPVTVSKLTLSTHSGSHADAPCHYDPEGADMAAVDVQAYIGPCLIVDVSGQKGPVMWEHVAEDLESISGPLERVLFRTFRTFPHDHWRSDFRAIDAGLITALVARGCLLIGTDAPSLDPEESKELPAHNAVREAGMAILEGLVLDQVMPGTYELIAPPLKIEKADASPVRALLRKIGKNENTE
ncbi:arylformamidase [Emcibacter nanhaiensis]|uniref:Kynurenine formamidase n=1 Tax=Emcibacter nanhaiensis TaxID=1505037 RepID=A0A501PL79_9PROT|nr:arylformamidase [Emcibacter nanhaiensis]TPD60684.1 arylformamidase [Emcibacter nanhaiensis]